MFITCGVREVVSFAVSDVVTVPVGSKVNFAVGSAERVIFSVGVDARMWEVVGSSLTDGVFVCVTVTPPATSLNNTSALTPCSEELPAPLIECSSP